MAHFAELDDNNKVLRVIVINNEVIKDSNNDEQENLGVAFCKSLYGENTIWKQTSYNNNFRKQMASVDGKYNSENNIFISPQPYNSWSLDENFDWKPPVAFPNDNNVYSWDEDNLQWILIE